MPPPARPQDRSNTVYIGKATVYVGIDPGNSGGICVLYPEGQIAVTEMLPKADTLLWLKRKLDLGSAYKHRVILEQVGGYIGKGAAESQQGGNTGDSMFKFGASYGALEMMLVALALPDICGLDLRYDTKTPQVWQRAVKCPPRKGKTKGQHKGVLANLARHYFPQKTGLVTLKTADAMLIALYARDHYNWI